MTTIELAPDGTPVRKVICEKCHKPICVTKSDTVRPHTWRVGEGSLLHRHMVERRCPGGSAKVTDADVVLWLSKERAGASQFVAQRKLEIEDLERLIAEKTARLDAAKKEMLDVEGEIGMIDSTVERLKPGSP